MLKSLVITGVMAVAVCFSILPEILSGPEAQSLLDIYKPQPQKLADLVGKKKKENGHLEMKKRGGAGVKTFAELHR